LSTHQPLSAKNTGKYGSIEAKKQLEAQWAEPVAHLSFCFEET